MEYSWNSQITKQQIVYNRRSEDNSLVVMVPTLWEVQKAGQGEVWQGLQSHHH